MIWPYALGATLTLSILMWSRRPLHARRNRPDTGWKPTGIRQVYSGHDQSKAVSAAVQRQRLERAARKVQDMRNRPAGDVVPFRRAQ